MAYYDKAKAAYDNKCEEEYKKLIENIKKSKNEEDIMLLKHIQKLEIQSEHRRLKIVEYQNFFNILQKLLPRQSSIHDTLY